MHRKVFFAIHNERQRLDKPADIAAFMAKHGVDSAKFLDAFNSFGVQAKQRQARQLTEAYKIGDVPTLGIGGRYYTSGALAGSPERSLAVADYLIAQSRKSRRIQVSASRGRIVRVLHARPAPMRGCAVCKVCRLEWPASFVPSMLLPLLPSFVRALVGPVSSLRWLRGRARRMPRRPTATSR